MDWSCPRCGGEGRVSIPESCTEEAQSVVCAHCDTPSAYVWCPHCGMGGQIAETDFSTKPGAWRCERCRREYDLPMGFYSSSIVFKPVAYYFGPIKLFLTYIPVPWVKTLIRAWRIRRFTVMVFSLLLFFLPMLYLILARTGTPSMAAGFMLALAMGGIGLALAFDAFLGAIKAAYAYGFWRDHPGEEWRRKPVRIWNSTAELLITLTAAFGVCLLAYRIGWPLWMRLPQDPATLLESQIILTPACGAVSARLFRSDHLNRLFIGAAAAGAVAFLLAVLLNLFWR